ncbi:MAG: YbaY family lipoprotein [Planctomycetaceae bacterium]
MLRTTFPSASILTTVVALSIASWTAAPVNAQFTGGYVAQPGYGQTVGGRWQLGVQVQNTETGVLLTQVHPGSTAASAGLAIGDRILTVAGHQVGYVDGRLVDLGDEINQHISPNGRVTLLIFSARTGQVQSGPLSLLASGGLIPGTALYRGTGIRLSRGAVLNVVMRDVSYDHWKSVVVAQTSVPGADRAPIGFQLSFNPAQCHAGHQYVIEAEVVDGGRSVLRTAAPVAVSPLNPTAPVALVLAPFATTLPGVVGTIPPGTRVVVPYDQINGWYSSYLGRQPTAQELQTWQSHLQQGRPVTDIQSYLLGSSEYYDRHRNDPQRYVRSAYESVYGNEPNAQQLQQWQQRYQQSGGIRSRFVQELQRARTGR